MKQESAMHNKRDVSAKGARAKVEAAKNIKKGMSYTLAFALINDALKCKCHLQAIAVEESILADRLASALYFGEKATAGLPDRDTLGMILRKWKDGCDKRKRGAEFVARRRKRMDDCFGEQHDRLLSWWKARNELLHGIVKSFPGTSPIHTPEQFLEKAQTAAEEGYKLVREIDRLSKREIRKTRAAQKNSSNDERNNMKA